MTPSLLVSLLALALPSRVLVHSFAPPAASVVSSSRNQGPAGSVLSMSMEVVETVETACVMSGWWSQLDAFWTTSPYTAAALVCGVKASAADAIAQDTVQRLDFDVKRNMAFLIYGSLYQGIVHEYAFNTLYPAWFGTGAELPVVAAKVGFNLLVQTTLVTLPVAYLLKALLDQSGAEAALHKYWHDIQHQQLLWKCFGLWGPVQCLTFSVVPEQYRVTFIAFVSFFWLIVLSNISSNDTTAGAAAKVVVEE